VGAEVKRKIATAKDNRKKGFEDAKKFQDDDKSCSVLPFFQKKKCALMGSFSVSGAMVGNSETLKDLRAQMY